MSDSLRELSAREERPLGGEKVGFGIDVDGILRRHHVREKPSAEYELRETARSRYVDGGAISREYCFLCLPAGHEGPFQKRTQIPALANHDRSRMEDVRHIDATYQAVGIRIGFETGNRLRNMPGRAQGTGCLERNDRVAGIAIILGQMTDHMLEDGECRRVVAREVGRPANDFRAGGNGDARDLVVLRGHDATIDRPDTQRSLDRIRYQRLSGEEADVLARNALGAAARRDNCQEAGALRARHGWNVRRGYHPDMRRRKR